MKLKQPIDATKYDIRLTWTGPGGSETPPDASLVEGWPFDPPDEFPGWHLLEFGIVGKDFDRYWCLWAREKSKLKARSPRKATPKAAPKAKTTPEEAPAAPRGRKKKAKQGPPAEAPTAPEPASSSDTPN